MFKWKSKSTRVVLFLAGILLALFLFGYVWWCRSDPAVAAREFFEQHFYFYTLEDIGAVEHVVTPEFYALLNRIVTEGVPMGYVVDACAWTDAQDGWFKEDPVFRVVRNNGRHAVVRLDYDFEIGSTVEPQRTLLVMERDRWHRRWRVADMEGPDNYPFVQSHEDWFEQVARQGWFMGTPPGGVRD